MKKTIKHAVESAVVVAALMAAGAVAADTQWYPLAVNATDRAGVTRQVEYTPLSASGKASQDWKICVSLPHMKDPFFLAQNYGMVEEANLLGVDLLTLDAGGYGGLANQISQIENCVAGGADAVVMVGIAADGMNNLLAELKEKNVPVIDVVNGVHSDDVAARVLTSPRDEGYRAGKFLADKHPAGSAEVKVAWLPGPAGAGFVIAFDEGFKDGIKDSAVTIVETKFGDVGKEVQARLVEDILQTHGKVDYIAGTAVMAEAAVPLLKARGIDKDVSLVSVYMTPGIYEHLKAGNVEAAGVSPIVLTSRIMLDQAVRVLEGKQEYFNVGTLGRVYTPEDIGQMSLNDVMAPRGFRPVFNLDN
ncbi:MAG: TMAO reductase system periplasmic protein TorT [Pseudodonghicola sp.]